MSRAVEYLSVNFSLKYKRKNHSTTLGKTQLGEIPNLK